MEVVDSMRIRMPEGKSRRVVEWVRMVSGRGHLCTVLGIEGNIRLVGDYSDMLDNITMGRYLHT